MTATLRAVNCDCDHEWGEYIARNPPLRHFPHLRPRGRRSVPFIAEDVPQDVLKVLLVSPPGGRAHAVLGALVDGRAIAGGRTYCARSPIEDHRRSGPQYAHDDVKLAALDALARLFSRQRVRVVYLRGDVAGSLARTALPRALFGEVRADYDRYYRSPVARSRGFECSSIDYVEGPGVVEHLRAAVEAAVDKNERLCSQ